MAGASAKIASNDPHPTLVFMVCFTSSGHSPFHGSERDAPALRAPPPDRLRADPCYRFALVTPKPIPPAFIAIRGARQHNLQNLDLDLPRGRLTVITGVSGSGKSSLAFDTLYAEGQRRYVE
jgi:ABC-type multidrug transport system fused ATPase/permease subunit